jgi:hypothetical protein
VVRFSRSEEAGSRAVWETLLIGWRHGEVLVLDAERGGRPG